jgi:hypothetical protein
MKRSSGTERLGLIRGAPPAVHHVEIVVRGRGQRWGWKLTVGGGLTARCLYVHQTEAAALLDAERCGLALQAVER